jgi:hypothetical protein
LVKGIFGTQNGSLAILYNAIGDDSGAPTARRGTSSVDLPHPALRCSLNRFLERYYLKAVVLRFDGPTTQEDKTVYTLKIYV